jgi:hypothetical protein
MSDHAKLSPSGAHRWIECPGSVRMTAGLPRKSSPYAAEGTAAHQLAEMCLRNGKNAAEYLGTIIKTKEDGDWNVTPDMAEAVQYHLDEVRRIHNWLGGDLHIEVRLDLTEIVPGMFGTGDAVIVEDCL